MGSFRFNGIGDYCQHSAWRHWMKEAMIKTTVYNEVKGWDTYWNADMPR